MPIPSQGLPSPKHNDQVLSLVNQNKRESILIHLEASESDPLFRKKGYFVDPLTGVEYDLEEVDASRKGWAKLSVWKPGFEEISAGQGQGNADNDEHNDENEEQSAHDEIGKNELEIEPPDVPPTLRVPTTKVYDLKKPEIPQLILNR
jgi:hypothetical protein